MHCSTLDVVLCHLYRAEETVRGLKDCSRLGMRLGTVAMLEKGCTRKGVGREVSDNSEQSQHRAITVPCFPSLQQHMFVDAHLARI